MHAITAMTSSARGEKAQSVASATIATLATLRLVVVDLRLVSGIAAAAVELRLLWSYGCCEAAGADPFSAVAAAVLVLHDLLVLSVP